jgi:pyruvate kinase
MLSGETATGNYPVQVIEKMTQIIKAVENSVNSSTSKHHKKKQNVSSLKQFVAMLQLCLMQ